MTFCSAHHYKPIVFSGDLCLFAFDNYFLSYDFDWESIIVTT